MFASNITQALVTVGNEPPRIQTGFENEYLGRPETPKNDYVVLARIPKYTFRVNGSIGKSPTHTIVIRDSVTGEIDYFDLADYKKTGEFGYRPKPINRIHLDPGTLLDKNTQFNKAPNEGPIAYAMGMEANVAFLAMFEPTEDAFLIGRSFAEKSKYMAMDTKSITVKSTDMLINTYGDEEYVKSFANIGEVVSNGILFASRDMNHASISDALDPDIHHLHDNIVVAPDGAEILDVDVWCSQQAVRTIRDDPQYAQIMEYHDAKNRYVKEILDIYDQNEGSTFSNAFSNLVTDCLALKQRRMTLCDKREPIDFIKIDITYGHMCSISKGMKFTGRDGAKGVIADVWEDEDMPVDEYGVRADIVISPESVFNRMNPAQFYEQFLNRACTLMTDRVRNGHYGNEMDSFNKVIEFLTDIRPVWAETVMELIQSDEDKLTFVDTVVMEGIYLVIPPFCKEITPAKINFLVDKWEIGITPVTYTSHYGGTPKKITTVDPVCIGSKYIYLLGKIPLTQMSAIQMGHQNQLGLAIKPDNKDHELFGLTPIRYGEDECCITSMAIGPETMVRHAGVTTNSPKAVKILMHELYTNPHPTRLEHIDISTEEVINSAINVSLCKHMMAVVGNDLLGA
jgi:hypothetical protein